MSAGSSSSSDNGRVDKIRSTGNSPCATPASPQTQPSAFASAFAGETEAAPKVKRKRNRMTLSCQPCHQRKQQCDREQPCQRCIHRGLPGECSYEQPNIPAQRSLTPIQSAGSINDRLIQLESAVSGLLGDVDHSSLVGLDALLHLIQNGDLAAKLAPVIANAFRPPPPPPVYAPPPSGSPSILMPITPGWPQGNSPPSAESLVSHFPSHGIRTFLLSHFFDESSITWLWPIVHRPVFDQCYMAFAAGQPQSLDFMALLAIVCASSLQFLPENQKDAATFADYPYGRHVLQRRLYDLARMLLVTPQFTPYPSIERIQALVLFSVYNENEGNLVESYNALGSAIRMAQAFAMHRDAETVWRMRPFDAEQRRRFWWILYCLDRTQSTHLRRPYMILDQHCDVNMPINLDQVHLLDIPTLVGLPHTKPTEYLFQLEHVKWAQLTGKMWDRCFSVRLPTYRTILDIEKEIRQFESEIAPPLNATLPQSGESPAYLAFQRQYLTLQVSHLKIITTRPFLFAIPQSDAISESHKEYLTTFSRNARTVCIYFCKQLLSLSHLLQKQSEKAHLRWTSMALRVFNAAATLAVAVVVDSSEHSKGLEVWIVLAREILRSLAFQNTAANNAFCGVDAICKRVQSIIGQRYPMPSLADSDAHTSQATMTSPPSLGDLLGSELVDNSVWDQIEATVFAGNLPGLEAMCGPMLAHAMDEFLNSCLPTMNRVQ